MRSGSVAIRRVYPQIRQPSGIVFKSIDPGPCRHGGHARDYLLIGPQCEAAMTSVFGSNWRGIRFGRTERSHVAQQLPAMTDLVEFRCRLANEARAGKRPRCSAAHRRFPTPNAHASTLNLRCLVTVIPPVAQNRA